MEVLKRARLLVNKLNHFSPELVIASTGSCYIHLSGCKVKCVRVANHNGHKEKPRTWQLRSDVSSSRKGTNRIYTDINRLVSDLTNQRNSAK